MQTKLSFYSNEIFKYLIIFFICFAWVNYYYANFIVAVIIAVFLSGLITYALTLIFYKKDAKIKINKQQAKEIKSLVANFIFCPTDIILSSFKTALENKGIPIKTNEFYLVLYPRTNNQILLLPQFSYENITDSLIISTYKLCKELNITKAIICGNKFSASTIQLVHRIENIKISLLDATQTYHSLLKGNVAINEISHVNFKVENSLSIKLFFQLLVNKNNAKRYFGTALLTLFMGMLLPFSNYYLVLSSILFVLSLISFYNYPTIKFKTDIFTQPSAHDKLDKKND